VVACHRLLIEGEYRKSTGNASSGRAGVLPVVGFHRNAPQDPVGCGGDHFATVGLPGVPSGGLTRRPRPPTPRVSHHVWGAAEGLSETRAPFTTTLEPGTVLDEAGLLPTLQHLRPALPRDRPARR
jgi:hypothetical protein